MFGVAVLTLSEQVFAQNPCAGGGMSVSFDLSKTNNSSIDNKNTYKQLLWARTSLTQKAILFLKI